MKKNAKPEFTQKWWSSNKSKTLASTGLGKALKDYEVEFEKNDYVAMLKALDVVDKKVVGAIKMCGLLQAETKAGLEKYKPLVKKKRTDVKKMQSDFAKNAATATVAPKQSVGKGVVVWKVNFADKVKAKSNPDWLDTFRGFRLELRLNDDILDTLEAEKDVTTPAFMVEDAQKACDASVKKVVAKFDRYEKDSKGQSEEQVNQLAAKLEKDVVSEVKDLRQTLEAIPEARWKKFVGRKSQYKAYKVKAGVDLAIGVLSTGLSGLAIAASVPTGGAGLVVGIVNGTRSIAKVAQQCVNLCKEAETVQKSLKSDLESLHKAYITGLGIAKKKVIAGKELSMSFLKGVLGTDVPFVATLPKCKKNYKLLDNKVAGVAVKGRNLGNDFVALQEKCEKLEGLFKSATAAGARDLLDALRKARTKLSAAFDKAASMNKRVLEMEHVMPDMGIILAELDKSTPDYVKVFDRLWPATVNVGLAITSAGIGFSSADSALKNVNAAVQLVRKLAVETKTQVEIQAKRK